MEEIRCPGCMQVMVAGPVCPHCGYDSREGNASHQLPVGALLKDRYRIGKVLGQGGFGITYLAWDTALKLPVAIKEYYPTGMVMRDCTHSLTVTNCEGYTGSQFARNRERFLLEARSLTRLGNVPQVVQVLGFFQENDTAYIVMEYLQGTTLKALVKQNGPLKAGKTLELFRDILTGLEQVHHMGLVHRDISPDNIMLLPEGQVKLLDFGAVRENEGRENESTQSILKHGYAPLEQYRRRGELGPWTDVYALCATMYFCMTGTVPPDAPERMMEGTAPDWDGIPGLTESQRSALEKGTALTAEDRVRSARQLQELLEKSDTEPKALPTAPKAQKKRSRLPLIAAAAVVLAAAAGFLLLRSSTPEEPETLQATEETASATETAEETEEPTVPMIVAEVFPCYAVETADGWTIVGEGLCMEIDENQTFTITVDGLPEAYAARVQSSLNRERSHTVHWYFNMVGEQSVMVDTMYFETPEGKDFATHTYLQVTAGPAMLPVYTDPEDYYKCQGRPLAEGIFWRISLPPQLEEAPGIKYSFSPETLQQFTFEVIDYNADAGDSGFRYYRTYELSPELQTEDPWVNENVFSPQFFDAVEKYEGTLTQSADGYFLQGEGLEISYTNDSALIASIGNLNIADWYYLSSKEGDSPISCSIMLKMGDNRMLSFDIGVDEDIEGRYHIRPEYLEPDHGYFSDGLYISLNLDDVDIRSDGITWRSTIPKDRSGYPVEVDMEAVTEVLVRYSVFSEELVGYDILQRSYTIVP